MGLTQSQFWAISYSEYVWMREGYTRRIEREHWQTVREVVAILYNVNAGKGKQKDSKKLIPLSIDPVIKRMTEAEAKEIYDNLPEQWKKAAKKN